MQKKKIVVRSQSPLYKELLHRADCLSCDLEETQNAVERLKETKRKLEVELKERDREIQQLKAKLYDITVGKFLF